MYSLMCSEEWRKKITLGVKYDNVEEPDLFTAKKKNVQALEDNLADFKGNSSCASAVRVGHPNYDWDAASWRCLFSRFMIRTPLGELLTVSD
eukprot:4150385-Amphidinium_carterae.1